MISKEKFEEAYNKFPPCKMEKYYFKYFSINTAQRYRWVS